MVLIWNRHCMGNGIMFSLMLFDIINIGEAAFPCLTTGSKRDFDKTRNSLKGLESYLSKTVSTLQGQINSINGKVKELDGNLISMEADLKRRQWMKYKEHCYFFSSEGARWTTAERRCREIGGYLAKVDDANENAMISQERIKRRKKTAVWLGMTDVYNGDWRWIYDETKPKYQNWYSGRPYSANNSKSKNRNCVYIYMGGKWEDVPCNYSYYYVCESNFCFS